MDSLKYASRKLAPFFFFFIGVEFLIRTILAGAAWTDIHEAGIRIVWAFLLGLGFDAATFIFIALPVSLLVLNLTSSFQSRPGGRLVTAAIFFIFSFLILFSATGEWFFWDEFQSRYNFIAVDYLVYTTEVIGNIRESYPVNTLISIMAAISLVLSFMFYKWLARHTVKSSLRQRSLGCGWVAAIAILVFLSVRTSYAEISENRAVNELARNGIFELFSAYRNNTLDYSSFYVSHPVKTVEDFLRHKNKSTDPNSPLTHHVAGSKNAPGYNLILITVESLSADFLKEFGSPDNLTPHLDKLIDQSIFFSNLYATGTRTVYGLSAITLSIPPVPGNSIVRRPHNDNLFSLGHVLQDAGYTTKFIYGGFGYFDNMNAFFANNGYGIVDRSSLSKQEISFANVWGVADDDLYRRVLKENDAAHKTGKPFFDMVMTTSNHRPFTYPDGKIDIPSHTGRKGGVKYTDYTINEFLREARKHPWFDRTIFVIVADHTASSSGKSELDPKKYHIPMWIYAPKLVKPQKIDYLASQIDVAPTILGLMGMSYESKFYGVDLMKEKPERAFISNYQQLGYLKNAGLIILKPVAQANFYTNSGQDFKVQKNLPKDFLNETVNYYQGAAQWESWNKIR